MPTELEAKFKVESHEPLRARLLERGAERLGWAFEINHIFNNAEGSMFSSDRGLRLRECRDEHGALIRSTLTYKGPREPGPLKRREEIEITIDDPAAAAAMLDRLGMVEAVQFQKRRESWRLGECLVELDEVPHLGTFVEIEAADEPHILQARAELGLADASPIRASYIHLLVRHCKKHGLEKVVITF